MFQSPNEDLLLRNMDKIINESGDFHQDTGQKYFKTYICIFFVIFNNTQTKFCPDVEWKMFNRLAFGVSSLTFKPIS